MSAQQPIPEAWEPVLLVLGRERTIKLINNGTSPEVAMAIIKARNNKLAYEKTSQHDSSTNVQ